MQKISRIVLLALMGISLAGIVNSCNKGPAEKVGEKIDNAVQDTKDAAHDAAQDVKKDLKKN